MCTKVAHLFHTKNIYRKRIQIAWNDLASRGPTYYQHTCKVILCIINFIICTFLSSLSRQPVLQSSSRSNRAFIRFCWGTIYRSPCSTIFPKSRETRTQSYKINNLWEQLTLTLKWFPLLLEADMHHKRVVWYVNWLGLIMTEHTSNTNTSSACHHNPKVVDGDKRCWIYHCNRTRTRNRTTACFDPKRCASSNNPISQCNITTFLLIRNDIVWPFELRAHRRTTHCSRMVDEKKTCRYLSHSNSWIRWK